MQCRHLPLRSLHDRIKPFRGGRNALQRRGKRLRLLLAVVPDNELRAVVGLLRVCAMCDDRVEDRSQKRRRAAVYGLGARREHGAQGKHQPFLPEQVPVRVRLLGYAVRIEVYHVAGRKPEGMRTVLDSRHRAKHHSGALTQELRLRTAATGRTFDQQRRVVPRVHISHDAGQEVDFADPDRHEHARVVALAQRVVRPLRDLVQRDPGSGDAADRGLRPHHEERRRHALAAYVRDKERQPVGASDKEVVEIPADVLCGMHRREDVHPPLLGERREHARHGALLYAGGYGHVLCPAHVLGLVVRLDAVGVSEEPVHEERERRKDDKQGQAED